MKIIQLTAGTGNFYCGTCLRDHALTEALRRLGHDTLLMPMYLPLVLEHEHETHKLVFGGINVYLQQKLPPFRVTPRWVDRLFDSSQLLRWASQRAGMTSPRDLGRTTISLLLGEQGHQRKELDKLTDALMALSGPKPDVISLSNALLVGLARHLKARLGVPIVCTLQGEDAFIDNMEPPYRDEAWQVLRERVGDVDAFIAISRYYADVMTRRLHLPDDRVHVVHNGIDVQDVTPNESPPEPPILGYLARMCTGKGLGTLVEAFLILKQRDQVQDMKLHIAGAMTAVDEPYVNSLRQKIQDAQVMADVTITPNLERGEKLRMLRGLSVFSVPATYGEAFGLYVLEALASGVPVVQPRHGAFPELLSETGGGILCPPDDPAALADAIESLLLDPDRRRALAEEGRRNVLEKFNVDRMARQVGDVFGKVARTKHE